MTSRGSPWDTHRRESIHAIFTADPGVARIQATDFGLSVICRIRKAWRVVLPAVSPETLAEAVQALDPGHRRWYWFNPIETEV
ncbi:MAG: hypothetical protein KA419_14455 [Acidobacteria bacterium]|nr:hypothetical protein [Acidobacteriota bacterium]